MSNMSLRISDNIDCTSNSNNIGVTGGLSGSSSYFFTTPAPSAGYFVYDESLIAQADNTVWPKVTTTSYWITPELVKIFNYLLTLVPEEFLKKMEQIEEALSDGVTDLELHNLILPKEGEEEKEVIFKELLEW